MEYEIYDGEKMDCSDRVSDAFLAVNSCGIHVERHHRTIRRKGRKDWHLLYVESGHLTAVIEEEEKKIAPGGFVIYPPETRQEYWLDGGVCCWVHFAGRCVSEILAQAGLGYVYRVGEGRVDIVTKEIFEKMILDDAIQQPGKELMLAADLIKLLAQLGRTQSIDLPSYDNEKLREVIIHMNRCFSQKIDLNEYATMSGLSLGRFMHVFKRATGVSPYAYVLGLRFAKAAELLQHTSLTIAEVAFQVGVEDALYFSRAFKRKFGLPPEKFRNKQR